VIPALLEFHTKTLTRLQWVKVRLATTGRGVYLSWNISLCGAEEKGKGRMTFPIVSWALLIGNGMQKGKPSRYAKERY